MLQGDVLAVVVAQTSSTARLLQHKRHHILQHQRMRSSSSSSSQAVPHLTVLDLDPAQVHVSQLGEGGGLQIDLVGRALIAVINDLHGLAGDRAAGLSVTNGGNRWGAGEGWWEGQQEQR